jgi:hypothetical protein
MFRLRLNTKTGRKATSGLGDLDRSMLKLGLKLVLAENIKRDSLQKQ